MKQVATAFAVLSLSSPIHLYPGYVTKIECEGILPIMAMGYLAKNIYGHVTGDPNAKLESVRVVVGIACLMGLSGVWNFIVSQAR